MKTNNSKVYNPFELKECLDAKIVGQCNAKKQVCMAIGNHNVNFTGNESKYYNKQNLLVLGPQGSGKSETIQILKNLVKVPFIVEDAYTLMKSENLINTISNDLLTEANDDDELASVGIVVIENFDYALTQDPTKFIIDKDGVKFLSLLTRLMQGNIAVNFDILEEDGSTTKKVVSFQKVLFIVTGVLDGIELIVRYRKGSNKIGFLQGKGKFKDIYEQIEIADLIKYGLNSTFLDNFSNIVSYTKRSTEEVIQLIKESDILKFYKEKFALNNVNLYIEEDAIVNLGRYCSQKNLGIWSIKNIIEKKMTILEFESVYENKVDKIIIDSFLDI